MLSSYAGNEGLLDCATLFRPELRCSRGSSNVIFRSIIANSLLLKRLLDYSVSDYAQIRSVGQGGIVSTPVSAHVRTLVRRFVVLSKWVLDPG